MTDRDVEVRESADVAGELPEIAAMLRRCFPGAVHLDRAFLEWQYLGNPDGPTRCLHAYDEGRLVGHAAFSAMRARLHGTETTGVLIHNVATDSDQAGRGIFSSLLAAGLDVMTTENHGFAIAVPNEQSVGSFVKRNGFASLGALEARLGIGSMPAADLAWSAGFERLWSDEALRWRLSRPGARYGARLIDGQLRIECDTGTLGIRAEIASLPSGAGGDLPELSVSLSPISLYVGVDSTRNWSARPYFNLPAPLRPAPLHLVFRDLTASPRGLQRADVRFRLLDFDAY